MENITTNQEEEVKEYPQNVQGLVPTLISKEKTPHGNVNNLYIENAITKVKQQDLGEHNNEFSDSDDDHYMES